MDHKLDSVHNLQLECEQLFTEIETLGRQTDIATMTMAEATPPPASRRFSPTPIETTAKKVRRFSPELVETTSRSCRRENLPDMDNVSADSKDVAHRRRFVPELVEASSWSNKHAANLSPPLEPKPSEPKSAQVPQIPAPGEMPAPRRRFVPELIETTKRTKRAGDTRPATLPTDKVIVSYLGAVIGYN